MMKKLKTMKKLADVDMQEKKKSLQKKIKRKTRKKKRDCDNKTKNIYEKRLMQLF